MKGPRRVRVEVEVPEDVDEKIFERLVIEEAERVSRLLEEWGRRLTDRNPTSEEEALLREIKLMVAKRAEES